MSMVNFEFLIRKSDVMHVHADVEIFFVLDGSVKFVLEDKEYILKKEDFIVINSNQKHFFSATEEFLAASMKISYSVLSKMMKKEIFFFMCNTVVEESEAIDEIRMILRKIVSQQYKNKGENEIYMNSLYYEMLHILTTDFLIHKNDKNYVTEEHKFDDRKYQITEYVHENYDKDISLKDLADKLYLSNSYLSKYIKRQFGMNFVEYVNSVRLNFAVAQLLHSDKPLIRIAMDTGFASSAALNKVFKEKYSMTPTEYRLQWRQKAEQNKRIRNAEEVKIEKHVNNYFELNKDFSTKRPREKEEYIVLDRIQRTPFDNIWTKMINMGSITDLLHSDMQQHILYLKKKLHFSYVRFWDIYADELQMTIGNGIYNFDKIDRVLDFLIRNDIRPYFELRNKPKMLINNGQEYLQIRQSSRSIPIDNLEEFISKFIIHLINRYTATEVAKWYFEIWKATNETQISPVALNHEDSIGEYLDSFDVVAGTLRKYLPGINIGGGGFDLRKGEEHFYDILTEWKKHKNLPDFISIYCYPYTVDSISRGRAQAFDIEQIKKNVIKTREIMNAAEFPVQKLHITEWSFSVSSRNVLNDHCMKGAYLMKNMMDTIGLADMMGYFYGSDLFADYFDSKYILNGGGGLITKDGIPKPAFYSLEFINHLGKYLLKNGNNYIITDNGTGNYRIICHNLKNLSHQYGLSAENEHSIQEVNNLFSDVKKNRIHFELPAIEGVKYDIRIRSVNSKQGSILDEWMEVAGEMELHPQDVEYLNRITLPKLVHHQCEETNGKLRFETILEANEIQFIHASIKYGS